MTHIIPAITARVLPNGDIAVDLACLLDNIHINQVIAHYKAGELLCLMEWRDIKAHIDEIKMSNNET